MSDPVTPEEIALLRALCAAATPAPWAWADDSFLWNVESDRSVLAHGEEVAWPVSDADRELIVAARAALPRLLDAAERLWDIEAARGAPERHWECQQRIDALEAALKKKRSP